MGHQGFCLVCLGLVWSGPALRPKSIQRSLLHLNNLRSLCINVRLSGFLVVFFSFGCFPSLTCSVYDFFFPMWCFSCLYRLCVYLKSRYIVILLTATTGQAGRLSDGRVGFERLCVQTQAISFSCNRQFSFVFKHLFCVCMSACSTLAKAGGREVTNH